MISRKKRLLGREQFRRWEWTLISCFLQFKSLLLFLSPRASQTVSKPNVAEYSLSPGPWGSPHVLLRPEGSWAIYSEGMLTSYRNHSRKAGPPWCCVFFPVNPAVGLVRATTQRVQWGIYLEWMMSEDSQVAWPGAKIQPLTVLPFLPFHHPHGSPIEPDSLSTSANALTQTNNSRVE